MNRHQRHNQKHPERQKLWRANNPPCNVEGCSNPQMVLKRGLCNTHLLRMQRHGSFDKPISTNRKGKGRWFDSLGNRMFCTISDCKKFVSSAGLCNGHYHRKQRYGDPLFSPIVHRVCCMGKCRNLTTASHQMCVRHAKSIYNARIKGTLPRIAREAVGNALKYGKLVKYPCEECGKVETVEAHHDDYEKPLDIRWLCKHHHNLHHWAVKKARQSATGVSSDVRFQAAPSS